MKNKLPMRTKSNRLQKKKVSSEPGQQLASAIKSQQGKLSVDKGLKFEEMVADLYRLLGAEVIQNIEVCQKKVDLLAIFPIQGSSTKHTVIVECKDEKKAVNANQRVMQFKGLLDIARTVGEADSAEIVTRVPWGDAAKGFAKKAGISLLTYSEKLSQLINFKPYLKDLISRFETEPSGRPNDPPLRDYYVDLSAEIVSNSGVQRIPVINTYIEQWLKSESPKQHLAILGEYGAGKSSLCKKLAHDLAVSYLKGQGISRIPILLNLKDFIGTIKVEAFITSFLDQECHAVNPKFELFKAMNNAGLFLLILDGLDEMAVKVDADVMELNLMEIEKLAVALSNKILVTGRPEYFMTEEEQAHALNPKVSTFKTREIEYEPIKILPWDEKQVDKFLQLRVPLIPDATHAWTFYRDRIRSINSLSDLSQRPVLLEMVVMTLPKLIESKEKINQPNLYRTYLLEEIRRQKILKKRSLLLSDDARFGLLQDLAVDLYRSKISSISFEDANNLMKMKIKPPRNELEYYTREFLSNSFLVRRGDSYYFSHKSILEYLVAKHLSEEIEENMPDVFGQVLIQSVVVDFLVAFKPKTKTLLEWLDRTKIKGQMKGLFLGGNAATLVCALSKKELTGRDLSGANLTGANLSLTDLRGTNFRGAVLQDTRLDYALFYKSDFKETTISNAQITYYFKYSDEDQAELSKFLNGFKYNYGRAFHLHSTQDPSRDAIKGFTTKVKDIAEAEAIRHVLETYLLRPTAIYYEEYEKLLNS